MRRLSLSVYSERGRWPELKMERLPAALMTVNLKREREVQRASSITIAFFSLQMFNVDGHWNHLPARIRPDLKDLLLMLLKPKAESTLKRYKKQILRFLEWCNLSNAGPVPPFSVSLAVSYLNKVYKSSNCYATLLLSHANLKRFHSFFLCNDNSPLNS